MQERILSHIKENKLIYLVGWIILLLFIFALLSPSKKSTSPSKSPSIKKTSQPERVPGQLIIKFKSELTDDQIAEILKPYNGKVTRKIPAIHRYVIQVPPGKEDTIIQKLLKEKLIETIESDYYTHTSFVPNDPFYATHQWGLKNIGQTITQTALPVPVGETGTAGIDIKIERAWDVSRGKGIKVAVLDTGIDMTHPDLAGKILANKVFIGSSIADGLGHGTHIAGVIAANTNNGQGISGICPECSLIIGKVIGDDDIGTGASLAEGIVWGGDQGAKVINMSLNLDVSEAVVQDAITYAQSKGSLLVAAAGNQGNSVANPPANAAGVISVAAGDNKGGRPPWSNYGTQVKLAAPGWGIYSTLPSTNDSLIKNKKDANGQLVFPNLQRTYDYLNGTSQAAPLVSGVAALVWATQYGTSADAVSKRLCDTADKNSAVQVSCGWLNAEVAVGAPLIKPPIGEQQAPPQTVIAPTFVAIGDCTTNADCLTTIPKEPTPTIHINPTTGKQTEQPPEQSTAPEATSTNVPAYPIYQPQPSSGVSDIPNPDGSNGLLQFLIQLIMELVKLLFR